MRQLRVVGRQLKLFRRQFDEGGLKACKQPQSRQEAEDY